MRKVRACSFTSCSAPWDTQFAFRHTVPDWRNYIARRFATLPASFQGGVAMRIALFTLAVSLWAVGFGHAGQVDLRKIDRTIRKEPAYQTKSPKYCLLVFGPEARSKAWLVLDGDTLYVDRHCNGD